MNVFVEADHATEQFAAAHSISLSPGELDLYYLCRIAIATWMHPNSHATTPVFVSGPKAARPLPSKTKTECVWTKSSRAFGLTKIKTTTYKRQKIKPRTYKPTKMKFYSTVLPTVAIVATTAFLPTSTAQQPICFETSAPFNAGFGDCSTYAEGLINNGFCALDVDSNGILAQDACAECGVCTEAVTPPTTLFCVDTDTPFNAGFGDCSTYAEGLINNGFCALDVDSNGILAQDACAECGLCVEAVPSLETCVATDAPFDAGFGDCSTYAEGLINNGFCALDVDSNGILAQDACAECGVCEPAVTTPVAPDCVVTDTPFNAGFGDCSTYAEGLINNGFCALDVDSNGILAQDACAECGVCEPAVTTPVAPDCVVTDTPFNAGFGDCSTYAEGLGNNAFCDQDVDSNGILAQDACAECGVCVDAESPTPTPPTPTPGGPALVSETFSS